jgi:rod shape determining protein RodA
MFAIRKHESSFDWLLVVVPVLLTLAGLVTMNSFSGTQPFFERQLVWTLLSVGVLFVVSYVDARVLRRSNVIVTLYGVSILFLVLVLMFGTVVLGAQNRFDLGFFAFQPSDPAQLVLVLVLAKFFSRRHIEIAQVKHILVSGLYAFVMFFLLFLQPDFGSAVIVFTIWLGMVLFAGISKKHLALVFLVGALAGLGLWFFAFADYQKERILTFLHPLADIQGAGYNAYQSTIAVGSGELFGKGIGLGTQSKLEFLPEYETDFIFAAFAEEWGFVGVLVLFALFGVLFWRLMVHARYGASTFETLTAVGVLLWFFAHVVVHVGMNVGLLPVTGTTIPFMSYGGSHVLTEFAAIGIVLAMSRYGRIVRHEKQDQEFVGFGDEV